MKECDIVVLFRDRKASTLCYTTLQAIVTFNLSTPCTIRTRPGMEMESFPSGRNKVLKTSETQNGQGRRGQAQPLPPLSEEVTKRQRTWHAVLLVATKPAR